MYNKILLLFILTTFSFIYGEDALLFANPKQENSIKLLAKRCKYQYKFKNVSDKEVTIKSITSSSVCYRGDVEKNTYKPGEEGVVNVSQNVIPERKDTVYILHVNTDAGEKYILTNLVKNKLPYLYGKNTEKGGMYYFIKFYSPAVITKIDPLETKMDISFKEIKKDSLYEIVFKYDTELLKKNT